MKVDTHLNILISFAYITTSSFADMIENAVRSKKINLMIDSGAFTKFNANSNTSHITLDGYCKFLERFGELSEKYVMLDVIGNAAKSKANYEVMVSRGLNPMFVMTLFDKDFNYMREAVSRQPNLCVAGGVTTKGTWMTKRFQTIYNESNKKALIHGLGYVTFPRMYQLPLYSVDSSSWKAAALRFGTFQYFDMGLKSLNYHDILSKRKKLSQAQKAALDAIKVTPAMFVQDKYHKGNINIESLACTQANIAMQKYSKRHGLDFFLAASNTKDLAKIIYVDEHFNDLSYEKYRKEFEK